MVSRTLLIIIILAAATTWYGGYAEECNDHGSGEPQSGGSGYDPYDRPSDCHDPYDGPYWPPNRHNPYDHDDGT